MKSENSQVLIRALFQAVQGLKGRHAWNAWTLESERELKLVQDGYTSAICDVLHMLSKIEKGDGK